MSEALSDTERVLQVATAVAEDRTRALKWYISEPPQPFGGKTAEALVQEGRAADVLRLINSYAAGALG